MALFCGLSGLKKRKRAEGNTTMVKEEEPWDAEAYMVEVQEEYAFLAITESKPNMLDEWFDIDSCWFTSQEVVPETDELDTTLETSIVVLNVDDEEIVVEEDSTDKQNEV
ncbi:hypothetical protein Hanom_Chr15g01376461 [Helianthus anomalus]